MRTADLTRLIAIEKKQVTQDATYGTENVEWVPIETETLLGRMRASVRDVAPSRSETVSQGLVVSRNQTVVTIRWRSDVDSSMRVRVFGDGADGQLYQIVGGPAEVGGRKRFLEMVCEKYSS